MILLVCLKCKVSANFSHKKAINYRIQKDYLISRSLKSTIKYINQVLATAMLVVFAIALTPFSIFHNHHSQKVTSCVKGEVRCMHKQHIVNHSENCLICSMHFEKTYTITQLSSQVFLSDVFIANYFFEESSCYTQLIRTSLRGPPSA